MNPTQESQTEKQQPCLKQHSQEDKAQLEKPVVASRGSFSVRLEKGQTYLYCTCGLSSGQPFCDGECEGTKFEPLKFTPNYSSVYNLCGCQRNQPSAGANCDGNHSHVNLDW